MLDRSGVEVDDEEDDDDDDNDDDENDDDEDMKLSMEEAADCVCVGASKVLRMSGAISQSVMGQWARCSSKSNS
jgi:hypothetical protein